MSARIQKPIERVYLAGAFGNYVDRESARRIGLLGFPPEMIQPAGNTALLGAKIALFLPDVDSTYRSIRSMTEHVSLNDAPSFQDTFVDEMGFYDDAAPVTLESASQAASK
jgi:uncharacterized 2Fe-2S/4Fe-4S cluster protein (DUF4445 family)